MGAYPWGFDGATPNASDNARRHRRRSTAARWRSRDDGALRPAAPAHDYAALVASNATPDGRRRPAPASAGPQPARVPRRRAGRRRASCDDGPFGKGTGGQLRYRVTCRRTATRDALDRASPAPTRASRGAQRELAGRCSDPGARSSRAKIAARDALAAARSVSLPGDPRLRAGDRVGQAEPRRPHADAPTTCRSASPTRARQYPAPRRARSRSARWIGAGYPDYPWIFATDGEYTAFAAVALGQFEAIKDHLRALRDVSRRSLNDRSGKVVARGRHRRLGLLRRQQPSAGQHRRDGQVPEHRRAGLALDRRQPLPRRDVRLRGAQPALRRPTKLDADDDGWPEGLGNVERTGHGPGEARQRRLHIRGLLRPRRHGAVQARPRDADVGDAASRDRLRARFEATWWFARRDAVRRLARRPGNAQVPAEHWIGVTPMEAELTRGGSAARARHARARRRPRSPGARATATAARARSTGPVPHRLRRRPGRQGRAVDLRAEHRDPGRRRGQLRPPGRRAAAALHRRQRRDDVLRAGDRRHAGRAARRDAGDLPVAGLSRRENIDRCWTLPLDVHAGVGPLRHRVAGRPPAARRAAGPRATARLDVVPQVPARQPIVRHGHPARQPGRSTSGPRRAAGCYPTDVDAATPARAC